MGDSLSLVVLDLEVITLCAHHLLLISKSLLKSGEEILDGRRRLGVAASLHEVLDGVVEVSNGVLLGGGPEEGDSGHVDLLAEALEVTSGIFQPNLQSEQSQPV